MAAEWCFNKGTPMYDIQMPEVVEYVSAFAFDDTVERLVQSITGHGMTIFARIDHTANAIDAGMTMPPTEVLIYGNPIGGTPIMQATPLAALDLPLRVLVSQREHGPTVIAFEPIAATLRRFRVPEDMIMSLEPAQQMLVAAVVRRQGSQ